MDSFQNMNFIDQNIYDFPVDHISKFNKVETEYTILKRHNALKQISWCQNRNSLEEVMNKVWVPQYIENQYISAAEPLEDFENILIEDINILKKRKTIIQKEIPVIATTKKETTQEPNVEPFFLNVARDFVKSGRGIWEHRGLFYLLGRVAYCFYKWKSIALTKPKKQDHPMYLKHDLRNSGSKTLTEENWQITSMDVNTEHSPMISKQYLGYLI